MFNNFSNRICGSCKLSKYDDTDGGGGGMVNLIFKFRNSSLRNH